jgi:hypothetical protein
VGPLGPTGKERLAFQATRNTSDREFYGAHDPQQAVMEEKMGTEEIAVAEPVATPQPVQKHPEQTRSQHSPADKYAVARLEIKKKKRRAHRITINRSHSNG